MRTATAYLLLLLVPGFAAAQPDDTEVLWDHFQDGTTQGWTSGSPNPHPPVNMPDGGPAGAGDRFLLVTSTGGSGAGSRLVTFNGTQWSGDYVAAGITVISMHLNNLGSADLTMRLWLEGPGGNFVTSAAVTVPAGSGWQTAVFSVEPDDLVGDGAEATLQAVRLLRLFHSPAPGFPGPALVAQLGVDNVTAAPTPRPVERVLSKPAGWSLASLPVAPFPDRTLDDVFDGFISAFTYDSESGYVPTPDPEATEGFWLNLSEAEAASLFGLPVDTYTTSLGAGWSLLGGLSEGPAQVLAEPAGALQVLFRFDPDEGYQPTPTIPVGESVWVNCSVPCEATVTPADEGPPGP